MTVFRVVDLKQYVYCPRLIYYFYCLPDIRPITYKMEAGLAAQDEEEVRAARRSLRIYGLQRGQTENNVHLESAALALKGIADMVITTDDNPTRTPELIPVDYKLTRRKPDLHLKLQLMAYGMLLHADRNLPVRRGFLYAIPTRTVVEIPLTPSLQTKVSGALAEMEMISQREYMPPPVKQRAKCEACEFRRFCNDVV